MRLLFFDLEAKKGKCLLREDDIGEWENFKKQRSVRCMLCAIISIVEIMLIIFAFYTLWSLHELIAI